MRTKAVVFLLIGLLLCVPLQAAEVDLPGLSISIADIEQSDPDRVSTAFFVLALLTVLSLAPALLVVLTSFTRIIIVLSMLRHAIGLQSTPPNTVLIGLALFLTFFSMAPVLEVINTNALTPYLEQGLPLSEAANAAALPIKEFMIAQTREQDLVLMIELAGQELPETIEQVRYSALVPAFMLSEIQTAFQIGFVVFLPFLLIDILVASVLMSMGMIMLPPLSISLPIKVLMFVLIDGWALLSRALVSSFF